MLSNHNNLVNRGEVHNSYKEANAIFDPFKKRMKKVKRNKGEQKILPQI